MIKNKLKSRMKNFTTIELLVSIAVILILTGTFLLNYQLHGKQRDLSDATYMIAQKIRKAQNMIMAQSKTPVSCGGDVPVSYGVYFKKDETCLDIFADKDGDNVYDTSLVTCDVDDPGYSECSCAIVTEECIERIFMSSSVKIKNIEIESVYYNIGWINFLASDLSMKINGDDHPAITIEICIQSDCSAANTKKVIVNNKGRVEIE